MTRAVAQAYASLLMERSPQVIETRKDYEARRAEVRELVLIPHRPPAQTRYLRLIATLVQAYESEHFDMPAATPLQVLRYLMEEREMTQAGLAKIVGSSGLASEIYNGNRGIGLNLARKLADRFGVPLVLFLGYDSSGRNKTGAR
jgi:HTH-type transcriptional regulator/antitoxin HigA